MNSTTGRAGGKPPNGNVVRAISVASGVFYTLYIAPIATAGIDEKFQLALWISWLIVVVLATATYRVGRVMARTAARADQTPSPLRQEPDLTHVQGNLVRACLTPSLRAQPECRCQAHHPLAVIQRLVCETVRLGDSLLVHHNSDQDFSNNAVGNERRHMGRAIGNWEPDSCVTCYATTACRAS